MRREHRVLAALAAAGLVAIDFRTLTPRERLGLWLHVGRAGDRLAAAVYRGVAYAHSDQGPPPSFFEAEHATEQEARQAAGDAAWKRRIARTLRERGVHD